MIDWTRAQLDAAGLQAGEPGRVEPLSADIRTPLASAYVDLFLRADLAIQLLDALWLQGELTDAGHAERTGAMRRAPLSVLGGIQRRMRGAGRVSRRCIGSVMAGSVPITRTWTDGTMCLGLADYADSSSSGVSSTAISTPSTFAKRSRPSTEMFVTQRSSWDT
jgi:hypothetical protein